MGRSAICSLLIALFALAGALFSFILAEEYYYIDLPQYEGRQPGIFTRISSQVCGDEDSIFSCATVSRSKYARLFGIPMAIYGLFFYLIVFFLGLALLMASKVIHAMIASVLFWLVTLGAIADMMLLAISLFLIDAFCPICIATYAISGAILAIAGLFLAGIRANPLRMISMWRSMPSANGAYRKFGAILVVSSGLLAAAGSAYAAQQALIRHKVDYIVAHKKSEVRRVVADFANQPEEPIYAPALRVAGDSDARVTIVEFSDFLCPYCAHIASVLEELVAANPGKVRLLFVNYPLDIACNRFMGRAMHQGACEIAKGAICAARQRGLAAYQQVAFGARKGRPDREKLSDLASQAGLSLPEFEQCLDHPETLTVLRWQVEQARGLGITGTPTVYINNRRYRGRLYKEALQKIIDLEIQRLTKE